MNYVEFDNVFEALGYSEAEAHTMRLRSTLMMTIEKIIEDAKLSHEEAATRFGVPAASIKQLLDGAFDAFTLDDLVRMLAHAGVMVEFATMPKKAA